jgi:hypothetical protein
MEVLNGLGKGMLKEASQVFIKMKIETTQAEKPGEKRLTQNAKAHCAKHWFRQIGELGSVIPYLVRRRESIGFTFQTKIQDYHTYRLQQERL